MRLLPHDQDTGGFFICLLRKKSALPPNTNFTDIFKKNIPTLRQLNAMEEHGNVAAAVAVEVAGYVRLR
jgi:hypothetical protein